MEYKPCFNNRKRFSLYTGVYLSLKTSSKIENITQVYKWVPEKINSRGVGGGEVTLQLTRIPSLDGMLVAPGHFMLLKPG